MKKLFRWQLKGIYVCIFSFFSAATFLSLAFILSLPVQEPFKPWIPTGAEVEHASKVHPGTFKVDKSLGQIKEKMGGKISGPLTVVYWEGSFDSKPQVEYWLPDGSGKYYYCRKQVSDVSWRDWLFFSRNAFFNEATGEFRFSFSVRWIFSVIIMALSLVIGLMFYTVEP